MIRNESVNARTTKVEKVFVDLVVVGGGLAGTCCAIAAAREGIRVALVQDRPVLGGNASSEIRLWALGATSHGGNNNRWAREGGVIDEILVENTFRNAEGNPVVFDMILLDKVCSEPNLQLFLNTSIHNASRDSNDSVKCAFGFNAQNSTSYEFYAPYYCDASGDGILGFLVGAAFRIGAEAKSEFGELLAADEESDQLLGHSLFFYSRDVGKPVPFIPPKFAASESIQKFPRFRQFNLREMQGCKLWWLEYGGKTDTVHDTEEIKFELWKLVYGIWDHIKNSGEYEDTECLTLDWVGMIPGKRESRRFEGDYMLIQQDIVEQRKHFDAVSFGGWAIDLHPSEGVYSDEDPCWQRHSKGVYQIPYRCLFSRNINNLFLAGRLISASHIAFASTRVMLTCAHNAQAVGVAAAMCCETDLQPRDLCHSKWISKLQHRLLKTGQFIPGICRKDDDNLARTAMINPSSTRQLGQIPFDGQWRRLNDSIALLLPLPAGNLPSVRLPIKAKRKTELVVEFRGCSRPESHTPDTLLERLVVPIHPQESFTGELKEAPTDRGAAVCVQEEIQTALDHHDVELTFLNALSESQYGFLCLLANEQIEVGVSDEVLCGVSTVVHKQDNRVNKSSVQKHQPEIGIDGFEFWIPERRPQGKNIAAHFSPPLEIYDAQQLANGFRRPTSSPNCWMPAHDDETPQIELRWDQPQSMSRLVLNFDTDFDHSMEQVLMGHPERVMPLVPQQFEILIDGKVVARESEHYQTRYVLEVDSKDKLETILVRFGGPSEFAVTQIDCY